MVVLHLVYYKPKYSITLPASDGCSPVRASRSLAPPTSAATPNSRGICLRRGHTDLLFSVGLGTFPLLLLFQTVQGWLVYPGSDRLKGL